ncbi:MAG: NAD(P)-dependent alcohol dehydrogenase [Pseudomonadota bacterium]|nr:NAD(P)-dependent alcohol dehydrogenase [Pseudomonadota bacterium]
MQVKAYAAPSATKPLQPFTVDRREPRENDVAIDILFCGVCHSDLHTVRSEWQGTLFPSVPGHEIVGRVTSVGAKVGKVKLGDIVGVGCMVDSCRTCASCQADLEQYCEGEHGFTATYNGYARGGTVNTFGGYSTAIVVDEHFVLKISHDEKDLAAVAPLLCAGITTYSPLKHWKVGPGHRVGVVGIGGLGHMAIKLASALGAHVLAFTTSESKREAALRLGANQVVVSSNAGAMAKLTGSLDFILDTVAAAHNLDTFLQLLKRDGAMTVVGVPAEPHPAPSVGLLIFGRRSLAGSLIGGIQQTQEMLDFCAAKGIVADIEMIGMQDIESAFQRMGRSDVKYRFVIDMASLK